MELFLTDRMFADGIFDEGSQRFEEDLEYGTVTNECHNFFMSKCTTHHWEHVECDVQTASHDNSCHDFKITFHHRR